MSQAFILYYSTASIMGCKTQFLKDTFLTPPFRETLAFGIYLSILESITFREALAFGIYLSILESITYCPMYSDCIWERGPYTFLSLSQLTHSGKIVLNSGMMCEVSFQIPRKMVRCSPVKQRRECWEVVVVVESPSHVLLLATPGTAAHQASLSLTIIWSLPKIMSI